MANFGRYTEISVALEGLRESVTYLVHGKNIKKKGIDLKLGYNHDNRVFSTSFFQILRLIFAMFLKGHCRNLIVIADL